MLSRLLSALWPLRGRSPKIRRIVWGAIRAEGFLWGKDMKLWPGGGRPWDWGETGTRHEPGIQIADVQELLDHGATVVVLSRGMQLMLETAPETIEFLENKQIDFHIAETNQGVKIYNDLVEQGAAVGGLFHSTC